jgi:hypothetical protein
MNNKAYEEAGECEYGQCPSHNLYAYAIKKGITAELTGRGDYIQPSIQPIKLRNTLPALRSNDLLCLGHC